jgi:hypothetical protein
MMPVCSWARLSTTCLAAALWAATTAAEPDRIEPARVPQPPAIDGRLDDEAWQGPPLALAEWLTYNPMSGGKLPQQTEVRAAYDSRNLYFAFRCQDPEPAKVRGTLSRRDDLWNDDWVGLSLDGVGNGQMSYDMFVNALGVQGDILTTPSAGENTAVDWIWETAGRRTDTGYEVELRLPLTSIRFVSGAEVRMGVMFWRRVSRLGVSVSWPELPPGRSVMEQHAVLLLRDVERPLTLDVIPSLTYSHRQARATPESFGPADSDPDAGVSVKYGVTSSVTAEATLNPDFSQVESDAFQVAVNQRFPLFFTEKRPFFMEGLGTFELAGAGGDAIMRTAVHTRRIVDPLWGAKAAGSLGKLGFALLAAGDEAPGRQQLEAEPNPFLGERKGFVIARPQYSLGKSSYLGAIFTDTEFGQGHNRVAGGDVSLRFDRQVASATFLATRTRSAEGEQDSDGSGGQLYYSYDTRPFTGIVQLEHYDRGFQMDTAFLNQVGITQGWLYLGPSFYPNPEKYDWIKRINPFFWTRHGEDRIQGGNVSLFVPGLRMNFTRQGFFRVDAILGHEPWAGERFEIAQWRLFAEGQFTRWLRFIGRSTRGRSIYYDPVDPFPGDMRAYYAEITLQPTPRFSQSLFYDRVEFDRLEGGGRVYTVDVLNTRTTFQVDRRLSLRAIVQYDSSLSRVLTDLLVSWELRPGTVAYAGYGSLVERREWDGAAWTTGAGPYRTSERGFFFKASYNYSF